MPVSTFTGLKRGGSYSRWIVKKRQTLNSGTNGVVAMPFTHDWGPLKTFVRCDSLAEFVQIFGEGVGNDIAPTVGWLAAYNAFKGVSADEPGAGAVLAYRIGATAAAKATKALNNTGAAAAITLTAKYEGTRGNNLDFTVEANAVDPTNKNDLVILEDGVVLERWPHNKTDITGLAAAVNAGSNWVTAGGITSGTALAFISTSAATGGNDGLTLVAGDWTAAQSAFESQGFEVFAPFNLSDPTITTALATWTGITNTPNSGTGKKPKRFTTVVGGALNETFATAKARTDGIDNENVVNFGVGSYRDTNLGIVMSPAQLVPRIAGIVASRGFDKAVDFAVLEDLEIVVGPTDSEIVASIDPDPSKGGVLVLGLSPTGVRIEKGVTTRVSDTADRPKETFGRIKHVFTMQSFERAIALRQETLIGQGLDVNEDAREQLVADAKSLLDIYLNAGAMQKGAAVGISADPPPSDDDIFVALDYRAKFGQALEEVHNTFFMG